MQPQKALMLFVLTIGLLSSADGQSVSCPAVRTTSGWLDLFPLPCRKHSECRSVMGASHLCCKGFCTKGIAAPAPQRTNDAKSSVEPSSTSTSTTTTSTTTTTTTTTTPSTTSSTTTTTTTTTTTPKPTTTTTPPPPPPLPVLRPFLQLLPIQTTQATTKNSAKSALLGVIPRECPETPLGELLFEVQSCKTDADCWPRVCCPDGARSYCRTAKARLDLVPIANQIDGPVRMLEQYLQCTPPPKQDLFPQRCSSSVDCFPNLCCAEGGKKHCRPPQRSLLSLFAGVTQ